MTDSKNPANKDKSESDKDRTAAGSVDFSEQSQTRIYVRNSFEPPTRTGQGNQNDSKKPE